MPNSVEASPTKVASKQPTAPPTSGRSSEEDAKDRRKKLVSFRSTDSIVPDQDEEKAETVSLCGCHLLLCIASSYEEF